MTMLVTSWKHINKDPTWFTNPKKYALESAKKPCRHFEYISTIEIKSVNQMDIY